MKKLLLALVSFGLLMGPNITQATPEKDRKEMQDFYKKKFPQVKHENYVFGALAFDADAMSQYNSIMEFPPFDNVLETARKMWETPFKNGKTYASCYPNSGKNVAGNYPMFDNKANKVVTLEMSINQCRKDNNEEELDLSDMKGIGVLTAHMRSLSDGMLTNIKVKGPAATAAFEAGKAYYYARRGQLNFACASCHMVSSGSKIRSELLSPVLGQSTHWPVFRGGDNLITLQKRYEGCNNSVRASPQKIGDVEFNNLEYFHTYMSNGFPLKASVFRK